MPVKVHVTSVIQKVVNDQKEFPSEGATIAELIEKGLETRVARFEGQRHLHVLDGARQIALLQCGFSFAVELTTLRSRARTFRLALFDMRISGLGDLDPKRLAFRHLGVIGIASSGVAQDAVGFRNPLRDLLTLASEIALERSIRVGMKVAR